MDSKRHISMTIAVVSIFQYGCDGARARLLGRLKIYKYASTAVSSLALPLLRF